MLSRPKEGSMGTGTGGYTSGRLGTFKDHLGYGSSLFGEGGRNGGKSSGMVSPDAAAGQIASKSFGILLILFSMESVFDLLFLSVRFYTYKG